MTPEQFLTFADPLPEPMLLLAGCGLVLAGNRAVEKRLGVALHEVRGKTLADLVADSPDEIAHYLRSCSRSRSLVLGSLDLLGNGGGVVPCRTEGALVRPRSGEADAILLLRLIPKASAVGQFVALNQRIEDLGREMHRRKNAEAAARQQAEWLRVTLHSIGDGVIATDPVGRVRFLNPVAQAMTGWTLEEATDTPLSDVFRIVNEYTRQPVENPALRAIREGAVVGLANHSLLIARDGEERPIDDSAAPIRDAEGEVVGSVLVFRDVGAQKKAERHRSTRLAVTDALSRAESAEGGAEGVLRSVCDSLAWDVGFIWLVNEAGDGLTCRQSWRRPGVPVGEFETVSCGLTFGKGRGLPGRVWASGKPEWILDIVRDANFPRLEVAVNYGLHSAFACPMNVGDRTLGVIEFFTRRIREADADLLETMKTVAGTVGQFIERKAAEDDLRRSEQELTDFFENATVGLHWVGADGTILRANRAELDMLGYAEEEYVGRPIADFHADEGVICDILERWKAGKELNDYPARLRCKDGSIKNVLIDSSVMFRDGQFVHTRCFTRDVTDRKRAEDRVREQEQRTRTILESITDAFFGLGRDWRFTYVNRQAEVLLGRTRDDLLGKNIWEEFAPAVGTDFDCGFHRAMAENVTVTFEAFYPPHDRWYEVHAYPSPDGLSVYFRDVGERKRAEAAVRESEGKLRLLADTIPQLAWMARPDGHIFWYNRRWYEYTGATPDEMDGWGWQSVHDPAQLPTVLGRWKASIDTGEPFEMVFPLKGADQRFRSFLTRVSPLRDRDGRVVYWFGTNTDITERIEIEKALRQSESQQRFLSEVSAALVGSLHYQSILRQVADLTVPTLGDFCFFDVLADDGRLERVGWKHVDPATSNLSERVRDVVLLKDDPNHPIPRAIRTGRPEFVPEVTDDWLQQIATSPAHLQFLRDLELTSLVTVPMVVGERRFGALTYCYSVSGRRHTTEEVGLAEEIARRAALTVENAKLYHALRDTDRRKDEFLATLAHELRNPLAPIRNSLQILNMPRVDAETARRSREMVERQVHHLVRLVDDLLDVSRVMRGKIELRRERVELATVVARAVETVQPLMDAQGHQLSVRLPPESLAVDVDPVRLAQVVGNLLTNAAKYTEANGHIRLTAERDGGGAVLRVKDEGIGIARDMLPRIFELFVQVDHASTKAQGGLGIGLTLVKNLVEMHNGTVEAHSDGLGKGSEFVVRLPISTQPLQEDGSEPEQRVDPVVGSGHRLLVVDDNQDAADSLAMLLRLHGHEVRVAHSGPAALETTTTYTPDVVFLDIGMPGMDGYEVARRLRQQPGLGNVVLAALTGWGQREDRRRTAEAGFDHHLVKPPDPMAVEGLLASLPKRNNPLET